MIFSDKRARGRLRRFVAAEHFRYRRIPDAKPSSEEVELTSDFRLDVRAASTPLVARMRRDFIKFLHLCMDVRLRSRRSGGKRLVFQIAEVRKGSGPAPGNDAFRITASDSQVSVTADGERGLLHACHYLERRMALRGGPFIPKGRTEKKRLIDPYISQPLFLDQDANLSLMSHFGVNGIWRLVSLWEYCRNKAIPELNTPQYGNRISQLRRLCERAAVFGMDVYLDFSTWGGFPSDAPVFKKHPDARGAEFYYSVDGSAYDLCSSNEKVLRCYNETCENLFLEVPQLGGVNVIVGGEGLMHCFSRPKPPLRGGTNCPRCRGRNPSKDVARLVNGIAEAVHGVKPEAKVFTWPYSADQWIGESDFAQTELIRHLRPDVRFLSNFETPSRVRLDGAEAWLCDYNILNIGPSEQFAAQSRALRKKGMPHYAKTESSTSVFFFFVPYIPVPYRWHRRYMSLRDHGVAGILAKWVFYGFTGSVPEELLCEAVWEERPEADKILAGIARRDFGDVDVPLALRGWRKLSGAWEKIPLSHLLFGGRHGYMKGPFWLGPAHPLILDSQRDYGLSHKFLKADAPRPFGPKPRPRAPINTPQKYVSDLFFTFPFSPAAVEKALRGAMRTWQQGFDVLTAALGDKPSLRAEMELDLCRTVSAHLRAACNVTRFYRVRDSLWSRKSDLAAFDDKVRRLEEITEDEIRNAEAMIPVLRRDPRIAYGGAYGQVYDVEMIDEKIRQCRYLLDVELPHLTRRVREFCFLKSVESEEE